MSETLSYIGTYQVVRLLGEGAFGEVYQAYQPFLDRQVAIKMLHTDLTANEGIKQQFMNEARTIAKLRHPNIVSVYEFGILPPTPRPGTYMVMEYLPGQTLGERLGAARLPLAEIVRIAEQLADGLDYAHINNVVHRDLKPANILFSERNQPVIVDFGLAKLMELSRSADAQPVSKQPSDQSTSTGTPAYMSPEQVMGIPTSPKSDQYMLGLIIYEMLAGKRAYDDPDISRQLYQRIEGPPIPIQQVVPELPAAVQPVLERALTIDPAGRYPNVTEFVRDLGDALLPDRRHARVQVVSDPVQAALLKASRQTILFGLYGIVGLIALVAMFLISLFLRGYAASDSTFVWDGTIFGRTDSNPQYMVTGFWPGSVGERTFKIGDLASYNVSDDYANMAADFKVNGQPRSALPPNWQPTVDDSIEQTVIRDGQPVQLDYKLERSNFKLVILVAALIPMVVSIIGILLLLQRWGAEPGMQQFTVITLAGSMALLGVAAMDLAGGLIGLSLLILLPAFIHLVLVFPEPIRYLERYPRRIWWVYLPVPFGVVEFILGNPFTIGGFQVNLLLYIVLGIILTICIILKWGRRDLKRYPGLWGMVAIIIASNIAGIGATFIFGLKADAIISTFGNGLNQWIAAYGSIFVSVLIGVILSPIGFHFVQRQLGYSMVAQVTRRL